MQRTACGAKPSKSRAKNACVSNGLPASAETLSLRMRMRPKVMRLIFAKYQRKSTLFCKDKKRGGALRAAALSIGTTPNHSAGFVLGRLVTRLTSLIVPRLSNKSMRSKRFNTLRFFFDDEPPVFKLLC